MLTVVVVAVAEGDAELDVLGWADGDGAAADADGDAGTADGAVVDAPVDAGLPDAVYEGEGVPDKETVDVVLGALDLDMVALKLTANQGDNPGNLKGKLLQTTDRR